MFWLVSLHIIYLNLLQFSLVSSLHALSQLQRNLCLQLTDNLIVFGTEL